MDKLGDFNNNEDSYMVNDNDLYDVMLRKNIKEIMEEIYEYVWENEENLRVLEKVGKIDDVNQITSQSLRSRLSDLKSFLKNLNYMDTLILLKYSFSENLQQILRKKEVLLRKDYLQERQLQAAWPT